MRSVVAIIASVILSAFANAATPDFVGESIDISFIASDTAEVTGIYTLTADSCSMPKAFVLFYPFPVDTTMKFPHRISASCDDKPIDVTIKPRQYGFTFSVVLHENDTSMLRVNYLQTLTAKHIRYIVTTTADWKKPLEYAHFTISLPESCSLHSLSYPFDTTFVTHNRRVWKILRKNFLPEKDIEVRWE